MHKIKSGPEFRVLTFGGTFHSSSFDRSPTPPQIAYAQVNNPAKCRSGGMAGFPMCGHAAAHPEVVFALVQRVLHRLQEKSDCLPRSICWRIGVKVGNNGRLHLHV